MIVGNGLLARTFAPYYGDVQDLVIFASGVSNSLETDPAAFSRERELLQSCIDSNPRRLVYFGSCGVGVHDDAPTRYMLHKREMEAMVGTLPGGMVLRLPQVVGATPNPNTLTNFIRDRIMADEQFTVWARAERNLVDVDHVLAIARTMIDAPGTPRRVTSIAAKRSTLMPDIVASFERVLQRRARYVLVDKGLPLEIDTSGASEIAARLGIDMGDGYAERIIGKYYARSREPQRAAARN